MVQERVQIIIEAISKNMARLGETNKLFGKLRQNIAGANQVLTMNQRTWKSAGRNISNFGSVGARVAARFRVMTQGLRGFRMEMLGVMFFGMAMANMFGNMLRPAADTLGIFQLWSTTLQLVFLPIMLELLPHLISLMTFLMDLPGPVKTAIGAFALIGLALGKLLFLVGTLSLGFGSLFGTSFFSILSSAASFIGSIFTGIVSLGAGMIAALLVIIVGFVLAWKTNFGRIKDWVGVIFDGIKNMWSGTFDWLKGSLMILVGIFTLNWDMIKEGFSTMIGGLKKIFQGLWQFIIGSLVTIGLSIFRIVIGIINKLIGLVNKIPGVSISKIGTGATASFEREIESEKKQANVQINNTYDVKVSDKSEFERLLQENNFKMASEVRRNTI